MEITVANLLKAVTVVANPQKTIDDSKFANQRVLLTTIYRFARIFAGLLWRSINIVGKWKDLVENFTGILDTDELIQHIDFVFEKHGIAIDVSSLDRVHVLKNIFGTSNSQLEPKSLQTFIDAQSTAYPSILTSLTQPIGGDAPMTWMLYGGTTGVRLRNNSINATKQITQSLLAEYGCPLCPAELEVLRIPPVGPLPWETGGMLYSVNPNSAFAKVAGFYNKQTMCGPSTTMEMMLDCAKLFGIDEKIATLAIASWMDIANDHSLFEILLAANPYFTTQHYAFSNEGGDTPELNFLVNLAVNIPIPLSGGSRKIEKKTAKKTLSKTKKMKGGNPPSTAVMPPPNCIDSSSLPSNPAFQADLWRPSIPEITATEFAPLTKFPQNKQSKSTGGTITVTDGFVFKDTRTAQEADIKNRMKKFDDIHGATPLDRMWVNVGKSLQDNNSGPLTPGSTISRSTMSPSTLSPPGSARSAVSFNNITPAPPKK
jgi:hypothetical protein